MDDGVTAVAGVSEAAVMINDLSMPEKLMLAEEAKNRAEVEKILRQVHYCWPESDCS